MQIKQDGDDVVFGIYNGVQGYGIYRNPDYDSVSCNNRFSPFYQCGISKNNTCKCWESKKNTDKHYNDEINELKRRIRQLEEEKIISNKLIEQQQIKINEQEERIDLYRMVVDMPEKDIVELINKSRTKAEFLDAMHIFGKLLKEY